jgi:hypothetical protein
MMHGMQSGLKKLTKKLQMFWVNVSTFFHQNTCNWQISAVLIDLLQKIIAGDEWKKRMSIYLHKVLMDIYKCNEGIRGQKCV